jgi:hypothetical protein
MGPDRSVAAQLHLLTAALEADLRAVAAHRDTVARALDKAPWPESDPLAAVVAVALHHYYGGVESLMERIAIAFEGLPVRSDRWHQDLLFAMTLAVEDARPALWQPAAAGPLRELLGFRHFFRHAYAVDLDAAKLERLARVLADVHPAVVGDVKAFIQFITDAAREG